MATEGEIPKRETPTPSSLPQKRVLEDDHVPAVSSPLNPDTKTTKPQSQDENTAMAREKRTKKESLKKRESKGAPVAAESSRATPDPKHHLKPTNAPPAEVSPMRYKLPPPKPGDFEEAKGPVFVSHHDVQGSDGENIEFFETTEHVYNKKNFVYTHCIADPAFPSSFYYRLTEPEPHGPHMSFEDAATHMFFDKTGTHITTDKGFRMARANVAVREGRWYWECKITRGTLKEKPAAGQPESHGHVRVGFARREASLDAPVGFDAYSYGIRDVQGQKVHMSRPKDFFPPGEEIKEGDVIGLEIQLPSEHLHRKVVQGYYNPAVDLADDEPEPSAEAPNIVRDRIPIRFKAHIYFEKIDYHTTKELDDLMNPSPMSTSGAGTGNSEGPNPNHPAPCMRTLPNSWIKVYKNGVSMGTAFTNLLAFLPPASKPAVQQDAREGLDDGMLGYYPAVSTFRGGAAEVNFGPKFWYPPPGYEGAKEDVVMEGQDEAVNGDGVVPDKGHPRAIAERYDEQIVEDVVYDIIDEVDFWMKDGGRVIDRTRQNEKAEAVGMTTGREEIKELVQDD